LERCFPDKESVAATLRQQYPEDLRSRVKSLMVESNNLSAVRFAESFAASNARSGKRNGFLLRNAAAVVRAQSFPGGLWHDERKWVQQAGSAKPVGPAQNL
jgi:hypothetical protein